MRRRHRIGNIRHCCFRLIRTAKRRGCLFSNEDSPQGRVALLEGARERTVRPLWRGAGKGIAVNPQGAVAQLGRASAPARYSTGPVTFGGAGPTAFPSKSENTSDSPRGKDKIATVDLKRHSLCKISLSNDCASIQGPPIGGGSTSNHRQLLCSG